MGDNMNKANKIKSKVVDPQFLAQTVLKDALKNSAIYWFALIKLRGQKHDGRDNHKESPTGIKAAAIVGLSFVEMDSDTVAVTWSNFLGFTFLVIVQFW